MKSTQKKAARGFKKETIAKIVAALMALVNYYMNILENGGIVKLVISAGNSKIGRCMNVSLAPVVTCRNCSLCKCFCYDVKACLQYANVRIARAKNTALFLFNRDEFFAQLHAKMARKKTNKFLRFHVSGEIMDCDHFDRMVQTARMFPDFTIWTYTKMYHIVNEWIAKNGKESIPENFTVMFSEWKGLPIVNPYNMPTFRCIEEDEQPPKGITKCPGNCDICKATKTGCVAGESKYVILH